MDYTREVALKYGMDNIESLCSYIKVLVDKYSPPVHTDASIGLHSLVTLIIISS